MSASEGAQTDAQALGDPALQRAATELLQALLRFNTVNPPGNERPQQEHLADLLARAGFEIELLGSSLERPNLIARLRGEGGDGGDGGGDGGDGPTLGLLSHADTVLANPQEWARDPWSGDLDGDGYVWGRGALDMKSQTAAEVAAAISLAGAGWRPAAGELLVLCVADEETGGSQGAQWLTEHHPDKVRCDLLLNEGGGWRLRHDPGDGPQTLWGLGCAEKGVFRFAIITEGVAGHASMPRMGDNALLKMGPLLERFAARQPSFQPTPESQAILAAVGEPTQDPAAALAAISARDPVLALMLEPMLGVSLAPTRISASEKVNVIPSRAELRVDCRVPPGLGEEDVRRGVAEVLGPPDGVYRLEFTETVGGSRSPFDSDFALAIRRWIEQHDPGAVTVPSVLPGFTDSRAFRAAFPDIQAYGFFPHRYMELAQVAPLIHGANERIDVRDLGFAAAFYRDMIERTLG